MNFKNYPKAIPYLFMTEMWERFSYYGITAILILYMSKTFDMTNEQIYAIYGAYGALVYMTPLVGGRLADKYLGSYTTVILGSLLIALGHFIVAIPSNALTFFYSGLAVIIVGTGLFMPNINAIVGHLYKADDPGRDKGFTLAYMGRNIGTILAPVVAAEIAAFYNWRWAFVVAGIGMLVGLAIFLMGRRYYSQRSFHKVVTPLLLLKTMLFICLLIIAVYELMANFKLVGGLLVATVLFITLYLFQLAYRLNDKARNQIFAAMILTAFYVVFLILLQQSGGALNLFTDSYVDRTFLGYTIETGVFQSVEPLALVVLTPVFNWMWSRLSLGGRSVSDPAKFVMALVLMSSSFVLMAIAMSFSHADGKIAMFWINFTYILQAAGELFIGPIGLAMVSRLIPENILGLYMGYWVLATAVANFIAARIGAYVTPVVSVSAEQAISAYQTAFWQLSGLGGVSIILLMLFVPFIKRLISRV